MKTLRLPALLLGISLAPFAAPQVSTAPEPGTTIEELEAVLVLGERPGPALWKVTNKKGNTLWILPTYGPLPDGLVLRSRQLEAVISQSQAVHFLTQINAPRNLSNQAQARKAYLNVDGKLLSDVMPPDLYAQFDDLNARYGGGSQLPQTYRPIAATDWLRQAAMQRLKLTSVSTVHATVDELARKHGVPVYGVKMKHDEVWDQMIARVEKTPREEDVPCARERLDRLEKDLQESVARANAWARGDITALRQDSGLHDAQTQGKVCQQYFKDIRVGVVQQRALRRYGRSQSAKWLKENRSTLVVIPIADLFKKDGLIAGLQRSRYTVEEPVSLAEGEQDAQR